MSDQSGEQSEAAPGPAIGERPRVNLQSLAMGLVCVGALIWMGRVVWENRDLDHSLVRDAVRQSRSSDPAERVSAMRDLGRIGPRAHEVAMPALLSAVKDPDPAVRAAAADSMGQVVSDPADGGAAATALIGLLRDADSSVRVSALATYRLLATTDRAGGRPPIDPGSAIDPLAALLGDPDPLFRSMAVAAIGAVGQRAEAPPPSSLVAALEAPDPAVRTAAADAVSHFTRGLDPLVPTYLKGLEDGDTRGRPAYQRAIRNLKPPAITAASVPVLAEALKNSNASVRCRAIDLLAGLGGEAVSTIPALIAIVKESVDAGPAAGPDDPARSAAGALAQVAPGTDRARDAVPALAEMLRRGQSTARRRAAAEALAQLTKDAVPAVPALVERIQKSLAAERDAADGTAAARALGDIAPGTDRADEAIGGLVAALDAKAMALRGEAMESLGLFGPAAARAVPRLKELAQDSHRGVRTAAGSALAKIEAPPQGSAAR